MDRAAEFITGMQPLVQPVLHRLPGMQHPPVGGSQYRLPHRTCCAASTGVKRKRERQQNQLAPAEAQEFLTWAAEAGVKADKLELAMFDGLRGMRARQSIASGETLVSIPRQAAILVTPGMACPAQLARQPVDAAFWKSSPWHVKMALLLLEERRRGCDSPLWGYVEHLPWQFDTLLHWSEAELCELCYPALQQSVTDQRKAWKEYYQGWQDSHPSTLVAEADFVWALECVRSRAFSGPWSGSPLRDRLRLAGPAAVAALIYTQVVHIPVEQILNGAIAAVLFNIIYDLVLSSKLRWYALASVIDSINHSSFSQSEVAYEYFRDRFSVTSQQPCSQGQQVFITYGQQSNDKLLQYYGFVEPKAPADDFKVHNFLAAVEADLQPSEGRRAALQSAGLLKHLDTVVLTRAGVAPDAMTALRALVASDKVFDSADLAKFQSAVSKDNERAALQVLISLTKRLQQQMSQRRSLEGRNINRHHYLLAQEFRQQKSLVLQAAQQTFSRQLKDLSR